MSRISSLEALAENLRFLAAQEQELGRAAVEEINVISDAFGSVRNILDAESRNADWVYHFFKVAVGLESILDEWKARVRRSQNGGFGIYNYSVRRFFSFFLCPPPGFSKIKKIRVHLDHILDNNARLLNLEEDAGRIRMLERRTSSEINDHDDESEIIFGRDEEKDRIVDMLLLNDDTEWRDPEIVSLIGMVGIGKTALARLVYNDDRVKTHFQKRIWMPMFKGFDMERIVKSEPFLFDMLDPLGIVRDERFLLVLDDVWSEDCDKLWQLRIPLQSGARGSCIMVTTRSDKVAREIGSSHFHYVQPLPGDDCWSLFSRKAFIHRTDEECLILEPIGREIVKKSGGVPLIAKALGNILSSKSTSGEWESALNREFWKITGYEDSMMNSLLRSYHGLPFQFKQCLRFCSLFPKNHWIEKETLVQLWMADGLIHPTEGLDLEEIGSKYFDDLLSCTCFFKDIDRDENDNVFRCKMHVPIHDLSCFFSNPECCYILRTMPLVWPSERSRLSSFVFTENTESFPKITINSTLHAILVFGNPRNLELPLDLFPQVRLLRMLDLSSVNVTKLPNSVGLLKQLRYLNLSSTYIKKLPESVIDLIHLQTLKLSFSLLCELPKATRKLINLRHLDIQCTRLNYLPNGIGKLTSLRKLSEFIVGGDNGSHIGELGKLNLLRGQLIISNLGRVESKYEAEKANMHKKNYLTSLILDFKKHFKSQSLDSGEHSEVQKLECMYKKAIKFGTVKGNKVEEVFEGFQPHANLKRLEIWNYVGYKFPNWMEELSLINLVSLKLAKCENMEHLPPLGKLPLLKCLYLCGMSRVKYIGHEIYEDDKVVGFPKLECITFEEMPSWLRWDLRVEKGEMPCLRELIIRHCRNLSTLPLLPEKLRKLMLLDCSWTTLPDLPETLRELVVCNCPSLTTVPHLPNALEELILSDCPELTVFPQIPAALRVLNICNGTVQAWNSCILPQLEHLVLKCKRRWLSSLPDLPKLVSLKIMFSSEVATLPHGLNRLKALNMLTISFCPKLGSLPEDLRQLRNLKELQIAGCPLLINRCEKERGDDWFKIAHIQCIKIDNYKIQ